VLLLPLLRLHGQQRGESQRGGQCGGRCSVSHHVIGAEGGRLGGAPRGQRGAPENRDPEKATTPLGRGVALLFGGAGISTGPFEWGLGEGEGSDGEGVPQEAPRVSV